MKGRSKPPVNLFKSSPPLKHYPDQSDNPVKEGATVQDILQQILETFPAQLLSYHWPPPFPFMRMMSELLLWLLMEMAVHLSESLLGKDLGRGDREATVCDVKPSALGNFSKGISVASMLMPLGLLGFGEYQLPKEVSFHENH